MARFIKKGKTKVQAISTASLPDIVFMLLFFFMVTTIMRDDKLELVIKLPKANQIKKLENKSLVSNIYIGIPIHAEIYGSLPLIQLNDALEDPDDVREFIASEREKLNEVDKPKMMISMKIDSDVEMGIVTDVKQALRKAYALKINYSAKHGEPLK